MKSCAQMDRWNISHGEDISSGEQRDNLAIFQKKPIADLCQALIKLDYIKHEEMIILDCYEDFTVKLAARYT